MELMVGVGDTQCENVKNFHDEDFFLSPKINKTNIGLKNRCISIRA